MIDNLLLVSDGCFVLNLIPYYIVLRYSAHLDNWSGFIFCIHMQICVPPNSDQICGLVLIVLIYWLLTCTIHLRRYQLVIIVSDKFQFIEHLPQNNLPLI